jgi:hypothetical protein
MKSAYLIIGLVIGLVAGFALTKLILPKHQATLKQQNNPGKWPWADSLDAAIAAPKNHHVIFENDKIRILEVILNPYEYEQMHTHRLPSVMFGASNGDTSSFDIIYYRYGYDALKHHYFVKDSIKQHNGGVSTDDPDTGNFMKPEGPHRIKNLSNVKIDAFRVEFKK